MIAIVDYDSGNLFSVGCALRRLGAEYIVTSLGDEIAMADRVILPGVGCADVAMERLKERDLVDVLQRVQRPLLGVCIGMQLMCEYSAEGDTSCLGIFHTKVKRLEGDIKIPEMGWNTIEELKGPLFRDIAPSEWVYYVHSYAADISSETIARTTYGMQFSAALGRDNFFGTQFHPEKSGSTGERILKNFLEL
ncbi:MAG: imidazole glycerol phosphate synthase subunit HisH [Mucinivorans sp.]